MTHKARLTPDIVRAIFTEAIAQEFGIRLPCEAAYHEMAKTMVSATMKNTPDREKVMLCPFPADNELWFVKKTVQVI